MKKASTAVIFVLLFFALSGCTDDGQPTTSFYYWKTTFKLSEDEKRAIDLNHVSKLYVRYCDVVLRDGKPVPLSPITFEQVPSAEIVPVIYIKNEVMLSKSLDTDDLVKKIASYIEQINRRYSIQSSELQLDCDWTQGSRKNYFRFIEDLKKSSDKSITVTIRLHQVKYYKNTGVPLVDRGVLMYYNMGSISYDSSNSIYERKLAGRYLKSLKNYPLELDLALPIFSWGIHIRNNRVIGLLSKRDQTNFVNDAKFERQGESFFVAKDDFFKDGKYFQKGDRVKIEAVKTDQLDEMASDLAGKMTRKPRNIIYYDLDSFNLKRYEDNKIFEKISGRF